MSDTCMTAMFCVLMGIGIAANVANFMMYANKKPGTSFWTNPLNHPECLTARGLRARKWVIRVMTVGFVCLFGSVFVVFVFIAPSSGRERFCVCVDHLCGCLDLSVLAAVQRLITTAFKPPAHRPSKANYPGQ